jgi:hypothetical protein
MKTEPFQGDHAMQSKFLFSLAVAGLFLAGSASAQVRLCAREAGQTVRLSVSFQAVFENAVIITKDDGRRVGAFNNYFRIGSGPEWTNGPGTISVRMGKARCLLIRGRHKRGEPSAEIPWRTSPSRMMGSNAVGFSDGGSRSYRNALVRVVFAR